MTQCTKCGYELSPNFRFCPLCATPVAENPSQAQPELQSLYGIPLKIGEHELYRTLVFVDTLGRGAKDLFILTSEQVIVVKNPKGWALFGAGQILMQIPLENISTVRAGREGLHHFVAIDLKAGFDSFSPNSNPQRRIISCKDHAEALDLASRIKSAM